MRLFIRLFAAVFPFIFILFQFLVLGLPLEIESILQASITLIVYLADKNEPAAPKQER